MKFSRFSLVVATATFVFPALACPPDGEPVEKVVTPEKIEKLAPTKEVKKKAPPEKVEKKECVDAGRCCGDPVQAEACAAASRT